LNGLYVNLAGRERDGVVRPDQRDAILNDIASGLLELRDPKNGNPVVKNVHRAEEIYSGPNTVNAPDLLIGFHRGYRASWATTMGDMSKEIVTDNDSAWSADHCIDASEVPGVIFSNKPLRLANPSLIDLAPTILTEFGVDVPAQMVGGNLFESEATARVAEDKE
jgi:predicted AlkP superfamily phosphohydrolase/phosphomutase